MFIKICGITNERDLTAVSALQPDAMGFICWPGSGRFVPLERLRQFASVDCKTVKRVGIFVDQTPEEIQAFAEAGRLDVLQLHGSEDAASCRQFDRKVWKAVHLDCITAAQLVRYDVDAFLVDSYTSNAPGGTGKVCDWGRAGELVASINRRVLLAGGLNPENIREAIDKVKPWGVDVSSGVESSPGVKDLKKVKDFIEQCRNN